MSTDQADVILVGGGLANSLLALRLRALRSSLKIVMVEPRPAGTGDHTWSFFDADVTEEALHWLAPLTAARWAGYRVKFPGFERRLSTGYASISEARLEAAVSATLGENLLRGVSAVRLSHDGVELEGGRQIPGRLVIDGRGARASASLSLGWQKFVGLELRLSHAHGLSEPLVMDASVPQRDGYRFVYVLPFDARTLLIEDTRYSDVAHLDIEAVAADALAYAAENGWQVEEIVRQERGVLPVALHGDIDAFWAEQDDGVPRIGMRAALFHPTTGYSLPDAARLADIIATAPTLESAPILDLVRRRSKTLWRERAFFRALNRMMFRAAAPEERWRVLARFYRLPQPMIERFYAAEPRLFDQLRTMIGKPPVPLRAALAALTWKGNAGHA